MTEPTEQPAGDPPHILPPDVWADVEAARAAHLQEILEAEAGDDGR